MTRPLSIAILECDSPIDSVKDRCGTYGDIFKSLFDKCRSVPENSNLPQLEISTHDVVERGEYPSLDKIDGVLLTGSKHDSFANTPWIVRLVEYVRFAFDARKPIIGICFGHQILARAVGAEVARGSDGWEVSVSKIQLTEPGATLFGTASLKLHQMHRDVVHTIPEGFQNLGTSSCCNIQGLFLPLRVLSVQAHPEFNEFIMASILDKRHADGVFSDAMYHDGITRAASKHDGTLVAKAILRFLESACRSHHVNYECVV